MRKKTTVTPRVLLAPRKKRRRTFNEARSMIQTRLRSALRQMTAANQALKEIVAITSDFAPGTFGMNLEKVFKDDLG